jgi:hypothetical protein
MDVVTQLRDWSRDSTICLTSWMHTPLPKSVLDGIPEIPKYSEKRQDGCDISWYLAHRTFGTQGAVVCAASDVLAQCEAIRTNVKRWKKYTVVSVVSARRIVTVLSCFCAGLSLVFSTQPLTRSSDQSGCTTLVSLVVVGLVTRFKRKLNGSRPLQEECQCVTRCRCTLTIYQKPP